MAGGRSQRMRATFGPIHKSLIPIGGLTMLERNICAALAFGFKNISIVTSANEPQVSDFVNSRGRELTRVREASIECVVEARPLGNVGIAREFARRFDSILMTYSDNLTTLNLGAIVGQHRERGALLTVAVHWEPFAIPYGEVLVRDEMIIDYVEKPERQIMVSSGTIVLASRIQGYIAADRTTNIAELVQTVLMAGERVDAFYHSGPWIDVNDAAAISRAENLISSNLSSFEALTRADLESDFSGRT
jgi:NDP-mannose synthase